MDTIAKMAAQLDEIQARDRRIETALFKVRERLGLIVSVPSISVSDTGEVSLSAWDVTLSQIKRALQTAGKYHKNRPTRIRVGEEVVALIAFDD